MMVGVPTKLPYSIILAGGDQIDKGLESLDDHTKNKSNLGRGPIWMRDYLLRNDPVLNRLEKWLQE